MVCVLLTMHGWWDLGRDFTLNRLEMAKAFGVDTLEGRGPDLPVKAVVDMIGDRWIKYRKISPTRRCTTLSLEGPRQRPE